MAQLSRGLMKKQRRHDILAEHVVGGSCSLFSGPRLGTGPTGGAQRRSPIELSSRCRRLVGSTRIASLLGTTLPARAEETQPILSLIWPVPQAVPVELDP